MASGHLSQTNPNNQKIIQDGSNDEMTFKLQHKKKETSMVQWSSSYGYTVDDSQTVSQDRKSVCP